MGILKYLNKRGDTQVKWGVDLPHATADAHAAAVAEAERIIRTARAAGKVVLVNDPVTQTTHPIQTVDAATIQAAPEIVIIPYLIGG